MVKHILLATNGLADSAKAEDFALYLAATNRAALTVLYVGDERLCHYGEVDQLVTAQAKEQFVSYIKKENETECRRAMENFYEKAVQYGISYEIRVRYGEPAKEIVTEAREKAVSLLVIGSRENRPSRFFRSTADIGSRVLKTCPCPVLVT